MISCRQGDLLPKINEDFLRRNFFGRRIKIMCQEVGYFKVIDISPIPVDNPGPNFLDDSKYIKNILDNMIRRFLEKETHMTCDQAVEFVAEKTFNVLANLNKIGDSKNPPKVEKIGKDIYEWEVWIK